MKKTQNMVKKIYSYDKHNHLCKLFFIVLYLSTSNISFTSEKQDFALPVDNIGYTAMHNAALNNDVLTIKALALAYPCEINRPSGLHIKQQKSFKDTPLHLAAYHGRWQAFSILISLGANLNARNSSNETPCQNVLQKEREDYDKALQKGHLLQGLLSQKRQFARKIRSIGVQTTIELATQLLPEYASIETQTETKTTEHAMTNTLQAPPRYIAPPSYPESHNNTPPSYSATCNIAPPPYGQFNPHAVPYCPNPKFNTEQWNPEERWYPEKCPIVTIERPGNFDFPELERQISELLGS